MSGAKTYNEWLAAGRQVKQGEKSQKIGGKSVFSIEQTKEREVAPQYMDDFDYDDPFIWDDITQG